MILTRELRAALAAAITLTLSACIVGEDSECDELSCDDTDSDPTLIGPCNPSGPDTDGDGIADGLESCLASRFAPILYVPYHENTNAPASAEWYLDHTRLRFAHDLGCSDEEIGINPADQVALISQSRRTRDFACRDQGQIVHSERGPNYDNETFFLTHRDSEVRWGVGPRADFTADWPVYTHTFPNDRGGVTIQYWYFFPYNDAVGPIDHEGDWEHVAVALDADQRPAEVAFYSHGAPHRTTWDEALHDPETGRLLVWIADGTHASYRSESECDDAALEKPACIEFFLDRLCIPGNSCLTDPYLRWYTEPASKGAAEGIAGAGLVDLGERGAPRQTWARYCGKWGEPAVVDAANNPPRQPLCQSDSQWLDGAAASMLGDDSSDGGGGGGGGGDQNH